MGDRVADDDDVVAFVSPQVLHALEYLQKHHIAHRDVRSDNLLLNTDGIVKVGEWNVLSTSP